MARLVHLAAYTPPQGGSFIPFMRTVLATAAERGWEVEAVIPEAAQGRDWLGQFEERGIPVRFASGSRRELTSQIAKLLDESVEPTILHTHFTFYDVAAALAARRRSNAIVYWHVHTVLSSRPRAVLANAAKLSIFSRYVSRILTPAADVAASLVRRRAPAGKVSVFPSAIDVEAFPTLDDAQRAAARAELGIPPGTEPLLHFSRHWQLKDGDIFLDALSLLAREGRPVVGIVNQGTEEASRAVETRGLGEQVKFVGVTPEIQKLYGAAEVMVASSRGEAMPFTVVEALCSGVPVVASELAGHRYLGDELDACAIVARDADQYAAAIAGFLDMDPQQRLERCRTARAWIERRLDVREAAERLLDDYERSLAEGLQGVGEGRSG
jgi:glycosyltransferase involved in cell wall biosynthesis